MKISKIRNPKVPALGAKVKKVNDGNLFATQLKTAEVIDESASLTEKSGIGAVESVVALQEFPDPESERSRNIYRDYGNSLLDRLDELRLGILAGVYSKADLADLAHKLREKQKVTEDSRLNEIIEEIELRAEVEIAKLARNL